MTSPPCRLQLRRRRGFDVHSLSRSCNGRDVVIVCRPGKWSNPFIVSSQFKPGTRVGLNCIAVPTIEDAIRCFREKLAEDCALAAKVEAELAGKNLACWCKPGTPCHGDVLLEFANRDGCARLADRTAASRSTGRSTG